MHRKPLKKVLIANRGEIACRIVRTARAMGIGTVAVYLEADRHALHVRLADEAVGIGPAAAAESYLRIDRIVTAARLTGADAVHPGYGFLAENPLLAEACAAAGLVFVGPPAAAMRTLGDKAAAKALARSLGIPVVPGGTEVAQDAAALAREAGRIGYPVMIKAAAGGGGRGMRLVETAAAFAGALDSAQREAAAAFGDRRVIIEKAIATPRHIEVQVFADRHGNVVHLYERDCSLQRRNQKIIEEAPAPGISEALRARLTGDAVKLAKAGRYEGAGTVEFLVEGGGLAADARYYFIEMNTRLQVEHPVTEAVTGLDLVAWQLAVAAGEPLPRRQGEISLTGHAVEARLCAEDPAHGFLPVTGRIVEAWLADGVGVRVDLGIEKGSVISPFYDSMIAKGIAHGATRGEALSRLARWLEESAILGLATNTGLLHALLTDRDVTAGRLDTGLIGRELARLAPDVPPSPGAMAHAAERLIAADGRFDQRGGTPWDAGDAFQLAGARQVRRLVEVDGQRLPVTIDWTDGAARVTVDGAASDEAVPVAFDAKSGRAYASERGRHFSLGWPRYDAGAAAGDGDGVLRAPITGRVARVAVARGATIAAGDVVAVVEAMKMEHVLHAPCAGSVASLGVREGQQVAQGDMVATIAAEGAP